MNIRISPTVQIATIATLENGIRGPRAVCIPPADQSVSRLLLGAGGRALSPESFAGAGVGAGSMLHGDTSSQSSRIINSRDELRDCLEAFRLLTVILVLASPRLGAYLLIALS